MTKEEYLHEQRSRNGRNGDWNPVEKLKVSQSDRIDNLFDDLGIRLTIPEFALCFN